MKVVDLDADKDLKKLCDVVDNYSVKIASISFYSSSDMQKFHHLSGCHAICINS